VLDDAMLLLERIVPALNTPKKHRADKDGNDARRLRVGQPVKRARIDAQKFDAKARQPGEN
jgi:hypothetical protein